MRWPVKQMVFWVCLWVAHPAMATDRAALGCAAGVLPCRGQVLTAAEIRFVLDIGTEADARILWESRFGDGDGLTLGTYRPVAWSHDLPRPALGCRGQRIAATPGPDRVLSRDAGGVLRVMGRVALYRYPTTPADFLTLTDQCPPMLTHQGLPALDWAVEGAVAIWSDDPPDAFGPGSGFRVLGPDRMTEMVWAGPSEWVVTLLERVADEQGRPVRPRIDRGRAGPPNGVRPMPPPLPLPQILARFPADPGQPCASVLRLIAALEVAGLVPDLVAAARAALGPGPADPVRCARVEQDLRGQAAAQAGPVPVAVPFLWGLTGDPAPPRD
jgi:hypothetical protein